jgi:methylenetetrahydrofolate dehydrogenase (NADP+)/methenyltetrahydrofolate cyclohydrolase
VTTHIVSPKIINAAALVHSINDQTSVQATRLREQGIVPTLAVVHVGEDAAAGSYRRQITRQATTLGIAVHDVSLPADAPVKMLDDCLMDLNADETVHGVLVQTPLAPELRRTVLFRLLAEKDVEGVTPAHLGTLFLGIPDVLPCTPAAILALIKSCRPDLHGARVVVVNGSSLIGRPLAMLLIDEGATPTICTVHTRDLASETCRADVLVVAVGHPHLIGPDHIAPGAVVVDAAINLLPGGELVGDVDVDAVLDRVTAITAVPGGVGPVTTAKLLANVAALALLQCRREPD